MSPLRKCSRTTCQQPAVATLTSQYAEATAVIGPLSPVASPGLAMRKVEPSGIPGMVSSVAAGRGHVDITPVGADGVDLDPVNAQVRGYATVELPEAARGFRLVRLRRVAFSFFTAHARFEAQA
ncbi:DUF3499 family protein, partial [Actinotignum timonense]|nr:DUF3499 family protein [Actinotignum timonense]